MTATVSTGTPALRFDGDAGRPLLLLAHGAGAAMDSPWMDDLTSHLLAFGLRVGRFEFPYMAQRRFGGPHRPPDRAPTLLDCWRRAIEAAGGPAGLAIGGKSMGGRMASMIADEAGVTALVCFGYPFHPPAKPDRPRTAHLEALRTRTLIVQGTRDPFGSPEDVARYRLSPAIRVHWLADGDHDLRPRKSSGHDLDEHLERAAQLTAELVRGS